MSLAIITARGGSKRIPRKNIRTFCGKPIIAYSIEAALKSEAFDEVMVSTDDNEIAEVAKTFGAKVPFLRSKKNSNDFATTSDVLKEVLQRYSEESKLPSLFCCIYPTAPFVTPEKLRGSLNTLRSNPQADSAFTITRFSFPIQRALKLNGGYAQFFEPKYASTRSQDLEPAYHDAGQFYWSKTKSFLETGTVIGANSLGIVISEKEVQDIDNETDWYLAEIKYNMLKSEGKLP